MTMHDGLVDQSSKFKKRVASADTSQYKVVERGQLVVGFPIDEAVLAVQDLYDEAIVSPAYGLWELSRHVDGPYLQAFLRSPTAISYYVAKLRGTTARRRSLPTEIFLQLPVLLPSLKEQRRIADILARADALRAKRREALALLDDLTQSIFLDMFSRGGGGGEERPFGELCLRLTVGVVVRPASHYVEHGVPALRTLNVKPGRISLADIVCFSQQANDGPLAKSRLRTGDLVISRTGNAGTTAVVPPRLDGANAIDLIVATPDQRIVLPKYLETLLNSAFGKRLVSGETRGQIQQHFNVGSLRNAVVPVPSLDRQAELVNRLDRLERYRGRAGESQIGLDELFVGLQARAFAGRL